LAVERVVLTALGTRIVQLVTDDPGALPRVSDALDVGQGVGADSPAGSAQRWRPGRGAVAQAALAVSHRGLSTGLVHRAGGCGAGEGFVEPLVDALVEAASGGGLAVAAGAFGGSELQEGRAWGCDGVEHLGCASADRVAFCPSKQGGQVMLWATSESG
jgi:hypothetical protein